MVIDLILDRRDGCEYEPEQFGASVWEYAQSFRQDKTQRAIVAAMAGDSEEAVKLALCNYIQKNGYNMEICNYVWSVSWLPAWWDRN